MVSELKRLEMRDLIRRAHGRDLAVRLISLAVKSKSEATHIALVSAFQRGIEDAASSKNEIEDSELIKIYVFRGVSLNESRDSYNQGRKYFYTQINPIIKEYGLSPSRVFSQLKLSPRQF